MHVCIKIWDTDLNYYEVWYKLQNFKKTLVDISPRIEKKNFPKNIQL